MVNTAGGFIILVMWCLNLNSYEHYFCLFQCSISIVSERKDCSIMLWFWVGINVHLWVEHHTYCTQCQRSKASKDCNDFYLYNTFCAWNKYSRYLVFIMHNSVRPDADIKLTLKRCSCSFNLRLQGTLVKKIRNAVVTHKLNSIWGSENDAAEDSLLLGCNMLPSGKWYQPFQKSVLPPTLKVTSPLRMD
jgi:hypothetical protein